VDGGPIDARSFPGRLTVNERRDTTAVRAALRARLKALGAPRGEVAPQRQAFMLATLEREPFSKPGWLFEWKYDGVRVLAERRGQRVTLLGRSGQVVTARYPEVVAALAALPLDRFLIDGELVALDARGVPSFARLQARMHLTRPADIARARSAVPVEGIFFDCLDLDGYDMRGLSLTSRRDGLERLLPPRGPVRWADAVPEAGEAVYRVAETTGLEGIVAKRADSPYTGTRSRDWIKIKCQKRQEFVVGGYTDPQGSRRHLGALHLGIYDGADLVYVSKVGSGLDAATLRDLHAALVPLGRASSPFTIGTPRGRGHHWVQPRLVAEVRFSEWTQDGGLRHPTFLGLRNDVAPEACRRETPVAAGPRDEERPAGERRDTSRADTPVGETGRTDRAGGDARTRVTNPDKVFWPDEGYTKGDLLTYYDRIAPLLLPYLRDRPVVLTRYPDGVTGKSFFQKDAPRFTPDWVRTERIYSMDTERDIDYFVVDDAEMLRYVVNLGTVPLHLWSSRVGSLDRPDWLVLDLDPKGAPFRDVMTIARTLHRILDSLALPAYLKTSGATGLHILVPLGARYTYEEARTFARVVAAVAVDAEPAIATLARPIQAREGKVYVDFGQNGHGQTIVAPFAVRPRPGAPASCPLRWSELTRRLDPARFTIRTIPPRFERMDDPLAPILTGHGDLAAALDRLTAIVGGGARRTRS
jgi:bifunctional non-homologous end joining protein LigD